MVHPPLGQGRERLVDADGRCPSGRGPCVRKLDPLKGAPQPGLFDKRLDRLGDRGGLLADEVHVGFGDDAPGEPRRESLTKPRDPGDPLRPGCGYEKQFRKWFGDRQPTAYAHVATDAEHPRKLALQYLLFYTFNDFTNKHEGDWEMAQLDFDAASPEAALTAVPYQIDLAQRGGGERGDWKGNLKLLKPGDHPVLFISTGSHASYFQDKLNLGKGASAGFGCDDTRHATARYPLGGLIHPAGFFVALAIVVAGLAWQARRTRWRPRASQPLRRRRAGGQILRASRRLYRDNRSTFIVVGAMFIPIAVVEAVVQWVLFHLTGVATFVKLDGARGAATTGLALLIGASGGIVASAAVTAAVAGALGEIDAGRSVTARGAYSLAWRSAPAVALATAWQVARSALLILTLVGIPLAAYRFVRTSLFAQAAVLENRTARASLRASDQLTRGQWWRTFGFTILVDGLAILSGPILGVIILLLSSRSLTFIDITGSIVYALAIPYAATALTLYYFDLEARRDSHLARA